MSLTTYGNLSRPYVTDAAPVDGVAGTGTFAGVAEVGAMLINSATGYRYQNTGTQASPTWTLVLAADTPRSLNGRFELVWIAGSQGLPQLNAVCDAAAGNTYSTTGLQAMYNADRHFEILGGNASSDDVTISAEGGIKMETDGGGTDSVILLPHLNAGQTPWTGVTWGTDQETVWEGHIKTGSAITNEVLWAGLKLTNTATVATDDDQAFFRYAPATNSGKWQAVYSIGGTDVSADTGITVALSTEYRLKVTIDSARIARFYINGVLVVTSTALTDAVDLIPYVGVLESAAAAKHLYVFGQSISRKFA